MLLVVVVMSMFMFMFGLVAADYAQFSMVRPRAVSVDPLVCGWW